jgi:hypothetical protein
MNDPATASRDFLYLRQCLAPRWAEADSALIESYVDQRFGPGAAVYYDSMLEGFFDDIGRALKTAAPVIANVAGGVARGAMSGSSLGLPGIIGGALAGGAGTALSSYGHGTARDIGNVLNTGMQFASQLTPMGQLGNQVGSTLSSLGSGPITAQSALGAVGQIAGGLGASGQMPGGLGAALGAVGQIAGGLGGSGQPPAGLGAAGQLASALGRPEVQQAMVAMQMGPAGRTAIPGPNGIPIPTPAIAGMVQNLAAQAIEEAAAWGNVGDANLAYMADANGEWVGDPSEDGDRSARVWDLLNRAQLERLQAAMAAVQQPPAFARRSRMEQPLPLEWRAQLTQDMLAGFGEASWDGEADEAWDGESFDEAWNDEAWEPEASFDEDLEPAYG